MNRTALIFVLVRRRGAPEVLRGTRDDIVLRVQRTSETGSYVATVPATVGADDFEKAWYALTIDAQHAAFFGSIEEATAYYRNPHSALSSRTCLDVLKALERLSRPPPP
jgi:hypothetical protein